MDYVMKYGVDIALVLIAVMSIADGKRKGFVKTVLGIIAFFVSVFIARSFFEQAGEWIYDTFLRRMATDFIAGKVADCSVALTGDTVASFAASLPEWIAETAKSTGVSLEGVLSSAVATMPAEQEIAQLLMDKILGGAVLSIAQTTAFLCIFVLSSTVLDLVIRIVNKVFKLPVLKQINRFLGAVLGAVKGVAAVLLISAVLCISQSLIPGTALARATENSRIVSFVSQADFLSGNEQSLPLNMKGVGII